MILVPGTLAGLCKDTTFFNLKIDRAFVLDLEKDTVDRQLALTITQLAHAVGGNVVAEGIETAAQADYYVLLVAKLHRGITMLVRCPPMNFIAGARGGNSPKLNALRSLVMAHDLLDRLQERLEELNRSERKVANVIWKTPRPRPEHRKPCPGGWCQRADR